MATKQGNILIVDDNEELLIGFKFFLNHHFKEITTLKNPNLIIHELDKKDYDVVLLDMNFSAGANTGNEGLYWMQRIIEKSPDVSVVLITAYGDVELAVKAIKEGAVDFIQKSWDEGKILSTILSAYKHHQAKRKIKNLKDKQQHLSQTLEKDNDFCLGQSPAMQEIWETIKKVAKTDANILILGENGTGKEVIARQIHCNSKRRDEIFVTVDVGALSETLFESELFGHKKGAFTDAKADKSGRFEIATGGTLFLDEIGNISSPLQSKLLSALQNRQVIPIGGSVPVAVDIRLICATNKPLYELSEKGTFREDLLYRINTIQIEIPPLRNRLQDVPPLADFFLKQFNKKYKKAIKKIAAAAMKKLKSHTWPGNIRELRNIIEKAMILTENDKIEPDDIIFQQHKTKNSAATQSFNLAENEKEIIARALKQFNGNMSLTAKKLGINRSTLYDKIKKYGI